MGIQLTTVLDDLSGHREAKRPSGGFHVALQTSKKAKTFTDPVNYNLGPKKVSSLVFVGGVSSQLPNAGLDV